MHAPVVASASCCSDTAAPVIADSTKTIEVSSVEGLSVLQLELRPGSEAGQRKNNRSPIVRDLGRAVLADLCPCLLLGGSGTRLCDLENFRRQAEKKIFLCLLIAIGGTVVSTNLDAWAQTATRDGNKFFAVLERVAPRYECRCAGSEKLVQDVFLRGLLLPGRWLNGTSSTVPLNGDGRELFGLRFQSTNVLALEQSSLDTRKVSSNKLHLANPEAAEYSLGGWVIRGALDLHLLAKLRPLDATISTREPTSTGVPSTVTSSSTVGWRGLAQNASFLCEQIRYLQDEKEEGLTVEDRLAARLLLFREDWPRVVFKLMSQDVFYFSCCSCTYTTADEREPVCFCTTSNLSITCCTRFVLLRKLC